MNSPNKEKTRELIIVSLTLCLIFIIISVYTFGFIEHNRLADEVRKECNKLNGTFEDNFLFQGNCWSIDNEGYKFYWHISEEGKYYKLK